MNMKKPSGNWHILLVDRVITMLFLAISVLAFGYWRAVAFRYGWWFFLNLGWWVRFIVSVFALLPIAFADQLWYKLRRTMGPYCSHYYEYSEPLFPDREYRGYRFSPDDDAAYDQADEKDDDADLDDFEDETAEFDAYESATSPRETVTGLQFILSAIALVSIVWAVAFSPLDDFRAIMAYIACLAVGATLALFASVMALIEFWRSPARQ